MSESSSATTEILMTKRMVPLVTEQLEGRFILHRLWEKDDAAAFLKSSGNRIRAIAAGGGAPVDAGLMDSLPHLEIVASFGVGYDHVDAQAAASRNVIVTNTPDVLTDEVADLAVGLLIATVRNLPAADRYLREGHWLQKPFPFTTTLRGRTVGILGLGRIGLAIAKRLEAFGVQIAYHSRNSRSNVGYRYYDSLQGMAKDVDVLLNVAPGGASTHHIINAEVLAALGSNGILVNVGRGTTVDEPALIAALRDGVIHAAGLDVYEDEPHVPQELIALENTVLLPHVGSATHHTRNAMGQLVVDNLVSWFEGKGPLTPVPETPFAG